MGTPVCSDCWRDAKGFEGFYLVSDTGMVWSNISSRILKPNRMKLGYLSVELFKNGISKRVLIHRLVAEAFIENPKLLPQVNHIDEDKANNRAENLEWCTAKMNMNHGTAPKRRSASMKPYYAQMAINMRTSQLGSGNRNAKSVIQLSRDGAFIKEYGAAREAGRELGINPGHIGESCKGNRRSAGGFLWAYKGRVVSSVHQY